MGLSTYQRHRRTLDWPDDVLRLADALDIERFSILGMSGGAPYVAACAYKIPQRLIACGTVSGVGSLTIKQRFLARFAPYLLTPFIRRMFRDEPHARASLSRFAQKWREPDLTAFTRPGVAELMAASLVGAFAQGAQGPAHEGTLFGRPLGFRLEDIQF